MAILQKLKSLIYPSSTASSVASPVKPSASPVKELASTTRAALSSSISPEFYELSDLDSSYSRMLKACSITTTDELLESSSPRLQNWGMTVNGKCLTAKITAYPNTESALSLSDILETHPDPKYFLSPEQTTKLLKRSGSHSQDVRVYDGEGISPTLGTMQGGNKQPKIKVPEANARGYSEATVGDSINLKNINSKTRRGRVGKGIAKTLETRQEQYTIDHRIVQRPRGKNSGGVHTVAPTLTGKSYQDNNHLIAKTVRVGGRNSPHGSKQNWDSYEIDGVIRRLTPLECERLQAFPDNWTKLATTDCTKDNCDRCSLLAEIGNGDIHTIPVEMSDTQRYKMCGNAVTTNVIQAVFERILATESARG